MEIMKICKQCGLEQPVSNFRPYGGGRKGIYSSCKTCEKLNGRRKYLSHKSVKTKEDENELQKLDYLYDLQRAAGLAPPIKRSSADTYIPAITLINEQIEWYKQKEREASDEEV